MSQRSIASGSSRREFLKAGAAAVALPAAVGLPDAGPPATSGRIVRATEQTYAIVSMPESRVLRTRIADKEVASAYANSWNRFESLIGTGRRAVLVRESNRVQLVGEPIEVEAEEPEDDPEEEPELVVTRCDVWIEGEGRREEALVCVEPERAERFATSFNTPGCRCHRAVVTSYQVVRPTADLAERIRA